MSLLDAADTAPTKKVYDLVIADPLLTVLIGLYVLKESLQILWHSLAMFMLAAPPELNMEAIKQLIREQSGIADLHHVHLWTVSETDIHFEAHLSAEDHMLSQASTLREKLETFLHYKFDINHATLQLEAVSDQCKTSNLP